MSAGERVRALREEFDRGFAAPAGAGREAVEDLVAIRLGGERYALRLAELAGVASRPALAPLPSRRAECLGLVSHGGALAALFSLPALLGLGASVAAPRWMALPRAAPGIALAFDAYDGFARVPASAIAPLGETAKRRHVTRAAAQGTSTRLLIDLASIVNDLNA